MNKSKTTLLVGILLILLLGGVFAYLNFKDRADQPVISPVDTGQQEDTSSGEIGEANPESDQTTAQKVIQGELLPLALPLAKEKGSHFLDYDYQQVRYCNPEKGIAKNVYQIERPWYLKAYDLNSSGEIILALEQSKGSLVNANYTNHTLVLLVDPTGEDITKKVLIDKESTYENLYIVHNVLFTTDGEALVIADQTSEGNSVKIFPVHPFSKNDILQTVKKDLPQNLTYLGVNKEGMIVFLADVSKKIYAYNLETGNLQTGSLDYSYTFAAEDGTLYVVSKKPDSTLSIEELTLDLIQQKNTGKSGIAADKPLKKDLPAEVLKDYTHLTPPVDRAAVEQQLAAGPAINRISVSTVDDLIKAIAPDRVIELQPGQYDLTGHSLISGQWVSITGDSALHIHDIENLTIVAPAGMASIISTRPERAVLRLQNTKGVKLIGLAISRGTQKSAASWGLVELGEVTELELRNCLLANAATEALVANKVTSLTVQDSLIAGSQSIGRIFDSQQINFVQTKMLENISENLPLLFVNNVEEMVIQNCTIAGNRAEKAAIFNVDAFSEIVLKDTTVHDNTALSLANTEYALQIDNTTIEENNFSD